jgi:hypothetical protein
MMKFGTFIRKNVAGVITNVTGLNVKLVAPGDNWSSSGNIVLTEVSGTGYYENSSLVEADDSGYYEVWTDDSGVGADSGSRVIVGKVNVIGLLDVGDASGDIPQNGDALGQEQVVMTNAAKKVVTVAVGSAHNKDFGSDPGEIPAIGAALVDGEFLIADTYSGQVKVKPSGYTPYSFLTSLQKQEGEGGYLDLKVAVATAETSTHSNEAKVELNIPSGAKVIGAQFRVESSPNKNWKATFSGGLLFDLVSNIAYAANTKASVLFDENANALVCSGETDLVISSQDTFNFAVVGTIRCAVYYYEIHPMNDFGA